ncbi:PLP-dependent aminotransferase family protein [Ampullimonas aquatilis]|uniref:MocR-like pyridoxine biosynthesis transcription factor PdxR n=1 Tax=Ampullimonas aquatilis TaxID=1341549 RepID=UPI003C77CA86
MLRPWDLEVQISRDSAIALHIQIVQAVVEAITRGRLLPTAPMPGSRDLAERVGVNRKTVVLAYDELVAQGWLTTQGKRGTFVAAALPKLDAKISMAKRGAQSPIHSSLSGVKLYGEPLHWDEDGRHGKNLIDFNDGVPDTRLIPYDVLSRAFRHALVTMARTNQLGYGDPRGSLLLRQALTRMLNMERGLDTSPENLCLVRGSQMGIFLAARILVRPGDCVAFEMLSYGPAREAFRVCGASVFGVDQDEHGLVPQSLERLCRKQRIRAVYVTPHHQFPTTVMMPVERRLRLLMLAEQFGFVIVEDDYDHEFHFDHRPMLPLASGDHAGQVIYIGSLSKVLAPGLRVGYLAASPDIVNRCVAEIMLIDRQGNAVTELAVAELMESGELKRHIRRALRIYEQRRNSAAAAIRTELSPWLDFDLPAGGLAFWLRLADGMNPDALAEEALRHRVRILPGTQFSIGKAASVSGVRLGFASLDEAAFNSGLQQLKVVLASMCC